MNIAEHPCYNRNAHSRFGRVHLPVAPRCNIQCKFCNRKFDCVNESRPGVTSAVLSPAQAMVYLEEVLRQKPNISVVGIAGPGETVAAIRRAAGRHVKQMRHCTRCRSDAVGLLGEAPSEGLMTMLQNCQHLEVLESKAPKVSRRPYVAVASLEGVLVNQHLSSAGRLLIYGEKEGRIGMIETRPTPEPGDAKKRRQALAAMLSDCRALLVSGVGPNPKEVLHDSGIDVIECEGIIEEAVQAVFAGRRLNHLAVRQQFACGSGCGGNQMGCG